MDIPMSNISKTESTMDIIPYPEDNWIPESLDQSNTNAISVQGVYKRYGKEIILSNFSMTVPEGCIYGLLGSSGCGKTTLLNCIIGITGVDIGEVHVKFKKLSDVGLMPQDTALIPTLTIRETLNYFGKIFGMSEKQLSSRIEELTKLLDLPSEYLRTDNLSGGQQRRVSLAVALLHNPKLLLLDEPTVGLDPLLSKSIWDYLLSLTNEQHKTVVITTHYIEEAKQAHYVGLMRQGKLIETGPPLQIMDKYNCSTLEEAFLQLSRKDDKTNTDWPVEKTSPPIQAPFYKHNSFSFTRVRAQFYKNILFLIREIGFMCVLITLPLIQCNSLQWALGRDPIGLSLAVVNDDVNNCSIYNCREPGCLLEGLSCCYVEDLRQKVTNFQFIFKNDFEEARELVVKNKAWGLIYFPNNFSSVLTSRTDSYFGHGLSNETIESGQIQVFLDSTDKIIEMYLKRKLVNTFFEFIGDRYTGCGWDRRAANLPVKFEDPVYGSRNPLFTHYQTAPFLTNFCFFLPMMLTPLYLLNEKLSGFLQRCISSGLTIIELFLAMIAIELILLVIQTTYFFIHIFMIYKHPFVTDVWLPFILCIYQGFSAICFGIFLSLVSKTYTEAALGGNGTLLVMNYINGTMWPLEGVHPSLKTLFWYSPLAQSTEALRSMYTRGWTFLHPTVYTGFISITFWTGVYIALSLLVGLRHGMLVRK